jgi:hypothetical protein
MRLASRHGIMAAGVRANSASTGKRKEETLMRDREELARLLLREGYEHRAQFNEGDVLFMRDPTVVRELGFDNVLLYWR